MTTGSEKINKSSKPICPHSDLIFIGSEYYDIINKTMFFYNCLYCFSTRCFYVKQRTIGHLK